MTISNIVIDVDKPLTKQEFDRMKKTFGLSILPDSIQQEMKKAGRPKVEKPKKSRTFKLSQDVIEAITATGKGYNAKVDKVLRQAFIEHNAFN